MDLKRNSDTGVMGTSPELFPSDATDVATSGVSSLKETSTHDSQLSEGQKFAKAQEILDAGYAKLAKLNKMLNARWDSDDNFYHPDM